METIDQFVARSARPGSLHFSGAPLGVTGAEPAAVGVDMGSGYTRTWASGRPTLHVRTVSDGRTDPTPLIRRG